MKWVILTCILFCLACFPDTGRRIQALPLPPKQILVSPWSVSQPNTVLGEVQVDSSGIPGRTDAMLASPRNRSFGKPPIEPNIDTEELYELVRKQAYEQYGDACDAVIKVASNSDHNGTVRASGIAVQFVSAPSVPRAVNPPYIW